MEDNPFKLPDAGPKRAIIVAIIIVTTIIGGILGFLFVFSSLYTWPSTSVKLLALSSAIGAIAGFATGLVVGAFWYLIARPQWK